MSGVLAATATGNYEVLGDPSQADHVIVFAYGFQAGPNGEKLPGPVNEALARFAVQQGVDELPWFFQGEVADALPDTWYADKVIRESSDPGNPYLDSWDILVQTNAETTHPELTPPEQGGRTYTRPLIIAQAHHVGRVAAQARKRGLDPVVPAGLPDTFDAKSAQWWTRSRTLWTAREWIGSLFLKATGKL